jgi:hypothetical protein
MHQVNALLTERVANTNLPVDKQIQHVVSLSANLQSGLDPIQPRRLEEFCTLQLPEKVLFGHGFLGP